MVFHRDQLITTRGSTYEQPPCSDGLLRRTPWGHPQSSSDARTASEIANERADEPGGCVEGDAIV